MLSCLSWPAIRLLLCKFALALSCLATTWSIVVLFCVPVVPFNIRLWESLRELYFVDDGSAGRGACLT